MPARDILTLNKPMAPRLIRSLYCIALVVILIGVLFGIARGIRTMEHQRPLQLPAASQSSSTADATSGASPNSWRAGQHHGPGDRGFRGPGGRGPGGWNHGGYRHRGFMMMRHLSPPVRGGLHILFALFRGLVLVLIVRVLAEMGTTILAMKPKEA